LSFLAVYAVRRDFWWTIIPCGSMLGIALLVAFDEPAFLFFGLAITFALLGIIPVEGGRMKWPWIPAAALLLIGAVTYVFTAAGERLNSYITAAILIGAGVYMLFRSFIRR